MSNYIQVTYVYSNEISMLQENYEQVMSCGSSVWFLFQTLYVDSNLMLCDCPGLVFPSFVTTKADLVVNGVLPIDQMRDCLPPTALVSFKTM